jgi:hypothetical protein
MKVIFVSVLTTFGIKWKQWDLNIYLKQNWFSNKTEGSTSKQFSKIIPSHLKPVLNVSAAKKGEEPCTTLKICYWAVLFPAMMSLYVCEQNGISALYWFGWGNASVWRTVADALSKFVCIQSHKTKEKIAEALRLHQKLTSFVLLLILVISLLFMTSCEIR